MGVSDRVFYACIMVIAIGALIIALYPIYFIIIASVSNSNMVNQGMVTIIPRDISFYGYQRFWNVQICGLDIVILFYIQWQEQF